MWLSGSGGTWGISPSWKQCLECLPWEVKRGEKVGGFGEAGGSMRLLCRPLQRDSGSLRLPLPGEVGLEILYQPQRTWFPNHSKSGFVLFCLSFSLSQALFPCLTGWQVFQLHPAHPGTRSHCVPYPSCFPASEGKLAELQKDMRWHMRGQSQPAPCWRRILEESGLLGSGASGCTSHLQIPESHPCLPSRASACS